VGGRDRVERGRRRWRGLQHDLPRPQLAAVAVELVLGRVLGHARRRRHRRRRRPLHRCGGLRLDHPRMRNQLHRRQNQTRAALVHAGWHEPRLTHHRLGLRPRGRQRRRLLPGLEPVRERPHDAYRPARHHVGLQRGMQRTLQPLDGGLRLHGRKGGPGVRESPHLPRREQL
jgi:hypothetical protein